MINELKKILAESTKLTATYKDSKLFLTLNKDSKSGKIWLWNVNTGMRQGLNTIVKDSKDNKTAERKIKSVIQNSISQKEMIRDLNKSNLFSFRWK